MELSSDEQSCNELSLHPPAQFFVTLFGVQFFNTTGFDEGREQAAQARMSCCKKMKVRQANLILGEGYTSLKNGKTLFMRSKRNS